MNINKQVKELLLQQISFFTGGFTLPGQLTCMIIIGICSVNPFTMSDDIVWQLFVCVSELRLPHSGPSTSLSLGRKLYMYIYSQFSANRRQKLDVGLHTYMYACAFTYLKNVLGFPLFCKANVFLSETLDHFCGALPDLNKQKASVNVQ